MDYTSIKVGQLPTDEISGGNFIPHEVAGVLKKATFTDLAAFIGASDAVGFRAVSVSNGGTLPATTTQEFILVGPGTYNNVGGGSTITVTEELNALVSNGTYWFIGVEIPIDAPPGNAIWGQIVGTLSNQTDLQNLFNLKADLVDGKVPSSQLPSYVDDVIEVANYAALPATGETGKIYITIDTEYIYRWSGSAYIRIVDEAAAWGTITGTLSNQTDLQNALDTKQDDLVSGTNIKTIEGQSLLGSGNIDLTKSDVGLSNVDNTSDANKPVSTAQQTALDLKLPYTGATGNVDLGAHKLTASDLVINHASGSGTAASITKGGNGEALTVTKSSGTGNAASILGGVTLLDELHLNTDLADDYIASAATWNAKQSALSGTGFVKISGTTISYDNSTYIDNTNSQTIGGVKTFSNMPILGSGSGVNGQIVYADSSNQLKTITNFKYNDSTGVITTLLGNLGSNAYTSTAYQPLLTNPITGSTLLSGNTGDGYIPRASSSQQITNSLIYDNGTNIGIGTYTPYSATNYKFLTIDGTNGSGYVSRVNSVNSFLFYSNASGSTLSEQRALPLLFETNGSEKMRLTTNGELLIGRTSSYGAGWQLAVEGNIYAKNDLRIDANASFGGSVGIGTTSPSSKLSVDGDIRLQSSSASAKSIIFSSPASNWSPQDSSLKFIPADGVNAATSFTVNLWDGLGATTERMRITSGGNVGIGTTSPYVASGLKTLAINDSTGSIFDLMASGTTVLRQYCVTNAAVIEGVGATSITTITNGVERMRITSGGALLVGTASVGGSGGVTFGRDGAGTYFGINRSVTTLTTHIEFNNPNGLVGSITTSGSTTSYNTSSDYRLKQDLKPINGLDLVSQIKVYDYQWKSDESRSYGVLAHELQEVIPQAVTGEKDAEEMQSVDYSKLVPILVQAIQEQNEILEQLKQEIEILKNK